MSRTRSLVSWILIGTGSLLCASAILHYARGARAQAEGRRWFEQNRAAAMGRPSTENPGIVTASRVESRSAAAGKPIARIRIPAARIDCVVFEGTDADTLEKGPGHVPGTELPGQDTGSKNCVITGHRDSHFRHLGWLRPGHRVELDAPSGTTMYRVVSREIVEPTAVRVLAPTETKRLTLITCYPFNYVGPAPKRLIVVAQPVS
ncbi:MAG TPA: class D sortase [Thermoanaerobaculia bacterium]